MQYVDYCFSEELSMKLNTDERVLNYLKKKIQEAGNVVAILGIEMLVEGGGFDLDTNDETYRVESKYGYSPDDMLSASFFNSKVEKFYRFYKNEVLGMHVGSTPAYDALLRLQERGKLSAVISQNYHGLPENIYFKRVIELNGNMHSNKCPRCNRRYGIDYIMAADGVPRCENCNVAIRPDIRLIGERGNAHLMTEAVNACAMADVLLILGKNMYSDQLDTTQPGKKQVKVLFSDETFMPKSRADFVIKDAIKVVLPIIIG